MDFKSYRNYITFWHISQSIRKQQLSSDGNTRERIVFLIGEREENFKHEIVLVTQSNVMRKRFIIF